MKKQLCCLLFVIFVFGFSATSFAATSIHYDNFINGSFKLESASEEDLSFQIIGVDYLKGRFKLSAEYGYGKVDTSFKLSEIQAGYVVLGGGVEINDVNLYLTTSQINITEEDKRYTIDGTAFGLGFVQAHPVEAAGAFYIDQIVIEFAPKATYKKNGVEPYADVAILVGLIKARYHFTSNFSGNLGYRLYFINLDSSSTELNGFSLGINYKF